MTKTFKPLLAPTDPIPLENVPLPAIVSPKADGFRLICDPERGPSTRSLLPIANTYVRDVIASMGIPFVDAEIITFTDGKRDEFEDVQSKLTKRAGQPEFQILAFDMMRNFDAPYTDRLKDLEDTYAHRSSLVFKIHEYKWVHDLAELQVMERHWVEVDGWEGLMSRRPDGRYKFGRSTEREAILLKYKRWYDDEGVIIGYAEGETNLNEAGKDELGRTKRSTAKDGKVPNGKLGSLHIQWGDVTFWLSGFTEEQAVKYWAIRDELPGQLVNFKFQGRMKSGAPRFPGFRGLRDRSDIAA